MEAVDLVGLAGIEETPPALTAGHLRYCELDDVVMRVQEDQQSYVGSLLPDATALGAAVEDRAEAAHVRIAPLILPDLIPGRRHPGGVLHFQLGDRLPGHKAAAAQDREVVAQRDQPAHELLERANLVVDVFPVDPG